MTSNFRSGDQIPLLKIAEQVRQDIQTYTEIPWVKYTQRGGKNFPIFMSCRYLVELGPRQLGLPVAVIAQLGVSRNRDFSGSSKNRHRSAEIRANLAHSGVGIPLCNEAKIALDV